MIKKCLAAGAALALTAFAAPAVANTTVVSCGTYAISLTDEVAIKGQAQAGSVAAFEKVVCERSSGAADIEGGPTVIPVFIQELGIATRVVIFPMNQN